MASQNGTSGGPMVIFAPANGVVHVAPAPPVSSIKPPIFDMESGTVRNCGSLMKNDKIGRYSRAWLRHKTKTGGWFAQGYFGNKAVSNPKISTHILVDIYSDNKKKLRNGDAWNESYLSNEGDEMWLVIPQTSQQPKFVFNLNGERHVLSDPQIYRVPYNTWQPGFGTISGSNPYFRFKLTKEFVKTVAGLPENTVLASELFPEHPNIGCPTLVYQKEFSAFLDVMAER